MARGLHIIGALEELNTMTPRTARNADLLLSLLRDATLAGALLLLLLLASG